MDNAMMQDLYRVASAASDAGVLEWAQRLWWAGGGLTLLAASLSHSARALALGIAITVAVAAGAARADEESPEVGERLQFIEHALRVESQQARAWEAGWSVVYVSGFGYGAYQVGGAQDRAARAEGLIGATKSVAGALGVVLRPLQASRGAHPLDLLPENTPDERRAKLVAAERLLLTTAHESDARYAWKTHFMNALLNLVGGAIVWAMGDFWRGLQSAGIGLAAGEITIWTQPWRPKQDLAEYRRRFGGLVGDNTVAAPAPGLRVSLAGAQLTF